MNRFFILILLFWVVFSVHQAQAQSLAFNNALYFEMETQIPINQVGRNYMTDTIITIPAGQVWKITSIISAGDFSNLAWPTPTNTYHQMYLNDRQIFGMDAGTQPSSSLPLWLPAGTYTFTSIYNYSSSYSTILTNYWSVSGLIFDVVP